MFTSRRGTCLPAGQRRNNMANLKSVLKCWIEFNLPALQKSLDETAAETAQRQDEAEKAKKLLIELTKEWRRGADEEMKSKVSPLIKAFQKEVDSLSKRSKSAESTFLMLYKNLLEIPDPVPSLKQAESIKKQLDKAKDLELENQKLRETLDEYHSEFAEVKNQEVTLNKLKEKIKEYEEEAEKKLKTMLEEKEKELQMQFVDREKQVIESKLELATKLGDMEAKLKQYTQALESSTAEIFDLKAKHEEELLARTSEIELLETDLERANQNLLTVEKYAESLKAQFQNEASSTNADGFSTVKLESDTETIHALEYQLLSKERELSQLMEEVHYQQSISAKTKDASEREIALLEKTIEDKTKLVESLHHQLKQQEDYAEIKREISVLKMIEFSGIEGYTEGEPSCAKPLEKLLVEKNKTLQSECTFMKVRNAELTGKFEELQKNCSDAYRTLKDQKVLITQLEGDLMNVRGLPSSVYRGEGVGAPSSDINAELVSKAVQDLNVNEVDELEKHNTDSLLPIISSQRERLREKNLELESQTRHQLRQINMLQNEVDTVKQDNVKLYEKIKFLQSYPSKGSTSVTVDDESVKRYSGHYEERIDPFNVFSRKEKQQRYSNLSAPEKVTLNMARFILSNKIARTLVFFYTIMLHCLVFLVLYKFAYTESCKRLLTPVVHNMQQTLSSNAILENVPRIGKGAS
ncbi:protein CASP-like [Hydractinia symbiolongicarpus]|uniref:protein CASP-like n=1 Tax=Hydractinia symbiolongicarpus TaxID=13093 RepID=UPI00254BD2D1|nr:protein CASP-like [Hydractinia symbiolongicarpus]